MSRFLKSLHARLLALLLIPLLFLSIAQLVSTYLDTKKASELVFDKLLVTLALSISEHALASGGDLLTDDLLEMIRVTTNDNLYYKVIGPDNSFVVGYEDIPSPPEGLNVLERQIEYYDDNYLEQAVRVSAVSTLVDRDDFKGWMTTFVAQTLNDRDQFVRASVLDSIWRMLAVIFVMSMLVSFGVTFGLRPLRQLQESVGRRDMNDLSPIKLKPLPNEIAGVVGSLNDMFGRLTAQISLTKSFVENAAHQLRTPVSALIPQTDLALRKAESRRERIAIGKIRNSANRIGRLTHQLLNLNYAESISISKSNFSHIDLAEYTHKQIKRMEEGNFNTEVKLDLQEAPIFGLRLLIGELIDNLVDNAIKYSPESSPIRVVTYSSNDSSILEISDQGKGIAPNYKDRVFERFMRVDQTQEGSGLGLSIVHEITTLHNGRVEIVDGKNGVGTIVRCSFPKMIDT